MVFSSLIRLWGVFIVLHFVERPRTSCNSLLSSSMVCVKPGHCKSTTPFNFLPRQDKKPEQFMYQVVIDAGSTGSRIHIFTFRRTLSGLILENAEFDEVEPGLSFYLNKPEEGASSVRGLLQQALRVVPKSEWQFTPVSLRATAGLRLLPDLTAEEIMKKVRNTLILSPFKTFTSDFISIMDGDKEGIFAWTTLNFLTDNLKKQSRRTVGALDLGGGSTQIVFKPISQETIMASPDSHLSTVEILGTQHDLYCHSYLGLGLMSARQAVFEFTCFNSSENGNLQTVSASPCIVPSYEGTWSFSGKEIMIHGNKSFSYENCRHYVEQIVTKVHQPAEIINRDFYAFSYYYDTALGLGLVAPNIGGALSLETYLTAAKKVCSNEGKAKLAKTPFLCLDAVYVTTLLRSGYGFLETQIFHVVRKVNNVELSWALGAALHMLQDF